MQKLLSYAALLLVLSASTALAHPHVWVTMQTSVVMDEEGLVTGIAVRWSFDDAYAQLALEGMDTNNDGTYDAGELAALTSENISSLRDYDYFMHIKVDDVLQPVPDVKDAGQTYINDKLALHFTVPLPKPVDPRRQRFEVKIFDPEFYIAFDYAEKDQLAVAGKLPQGCQLDIKPIPTTAELEQTRTMLAGKDKEWKPDPNEEFGSVFAQPVSVICTP